MNKKLRYAAFIFLGLAPLSANAEDEKYYGAVLDLNGRLGSERVLSRAELNIPLKQTKDQLLFADIRTVVSDTGDREGNVGLGYREVIKLGNEDYIAGGYGFFDRRKSEFDNYFSQVTVGGELLGEQWRGRANYYHPITNEKIVTNNPDVATLLPSGFVLVNPNDTAEIPLRGLDLELGYKVPLFKDKETWAHLGAYRFGINQGVDLNGARFRGETQINEWLRLGVESSYDNIRKDSHFFDVRVRIPLQKNLSKNRYALKQSIHRYMQEPIVRDVDIVATDVSLDAALATDGGRPERYYFVDNTAAAGGDGRPDTPFNSLADAEANVRGNSTIYVRNGDGAVTNQDTGITITNNRVRLLGAGINLATRQGTFIEDATTAPKITNTGGDAVVIDGNRIEVAGFDIDSPLTDGIFTLDSNRADIHDNIIQNAGNNGINTAFTANQNRRVTITNNTITGSTLRGITIRSYNGGTINATVTGNTATGNTEEGIRYEVGSSSGSRLNVTSTNNTANTNGGTAGLYGISAGDGRLRVTSDGDTANSNTANGFFMLTGGTSTGQRVIASNTTANTNGQIGLGVDVQDDSTTLITLNDTSTTGNTSDGLNIISRSDSTANATVTNHASIGNTQQGVDITADGTTTTLNIDLDNVDVSTSGNSGMFLRARSAGTINATLANSTIDNNTASGLFIEGASTADTNVQVDTTDITNSSVFSLNLLDNTTGTYNVDLGGGALGSAGQNRIFTSGNVDVFGNLNGSAVSAQSNWWGTAAGLTAGETNLTSGGSVDASSPLATDPRP